MNDQKPPRYVSIPKGMTTDEAIEAINRCVDMGLISLRDYPNGLLVVPPGGWIKKPEDWVKL